MLLPIGKAAAAAQRSVLAHLRADDWEQAAAHTHRAPRAEHGSNSQGLPRRADAISKAGVRRLDTGRVVRHALSSCGWLLLREDVVVRDLDRPRGDEARHASQVWWMGSQPPGVK